MQEIPADRIGRYVEHFPGPQLEMVLASVVDGNTRARFWIATRAEHNVIALLWDKGNNVLYLSGDLASEGTANEFASLINTDVKDQAIAEGLSHFKVRALSDSSEETLAGLFQDIVLAKTSRLFYAFREPEANTVPEPALDGVQFTSIDAGLLGREHLRNLQYVRNEVEWMWPSLERFYEQGFGIAALVGGKVVCWCTAEYVSRDKCGVGIETVRGFERKGIATFAAARFVGYCMRHNITPHWECAGENIGSVRVAEKGGFERVQEATFWAGTFRG